MGHSQVLEHCGNHKDEFEMSITFFGVISFGSDAVVSDHKQCFIVLSNICEYDPINQSGRGLHGNIIKKELLNCIHGYMKIKSKPYFFLHIWHLNIINWL